MSTDRKRRRRRQPLHEERTLGRMPDREKNTQTPASRAALEAFIKKVNAELWIEHDISADSKLRKSPQYYD
jgi:hypothetical protein